MGLGMSRVYKRIEMAQGERWHPEEKERFFHFDDKKTNQSMAKSFANIKHKSTVKKIRDMSLVANPKRKYSLKYEGGNFELGLIQEVPEGKGWIMHLYLRYGASWWNGLDCFTLNKMWSNGFCPKGTVSNIIYDQLIPKCDIVMSDEMESHDGEVFWTRQIHQVFKKGLHLYKMNLETNEYQEIESMADLSISYLEDWPWGDDVQFQNKRMAITSKRLEDLLKGNGNNHED